MSLEGLDDRVLVEYQGKIRGNAFYNLLNNIPGRSTESSEHVQQSRQSSRVHESDTQ